MTTIKGQFVTDDGVQVFKVDLNEVDVETHKLTATEALYGFVGWLTSREQYIIMGAHHEAASAAQAVAEFIKANDLGDVSMEDWNKFLTHPPNR